MQFNPVSDRRNFLTSSDPHYYKQQAEEAFAAVHNGFAMDIQAEMDKLAWCDALVLQFPLWWFSVPAIISARSLSSNMFAGRPRYARAPVYGFWSFSVTPRCHCTARWTRQRRLANSP